MEAQAVLFTSILVQLIAAFLALRLIRVTGRSPAWICIAAAITLINLRRGMSFYHALAHAYPLDLATELVVLVISLLFLVGISRIGPLFATMRRSEEALRLNESRLEALWDLSHMTAAPLQQITDFALEEAVKLTRSQIGYLAFMNEDETILTMHSWSKTAMEQCAIIDKPILYPLETTGLWGEAVRQRRPVITNDYAAPNPLKKGYPQGHVEVRRHMNVPVFDNGHIVAVAGVGNKDEPYDESDVRQLTLLMTGMWWLIKRRQAEDALTHEVERGHSIQTKLIQTCMDGIIANDMAGDIVIFNHNAARILGYSPEEVIGKVNVRDLYPAGLAQEIKQKIYDPAWGGTGILENFETTARHKDGALIPIWLSARVLHEDGQEVGIIGHFRDLRERKKMEEDLLRNERLAVLGKMMAHISHEIKNPLMLIGGFARQLERNQEMPDEARRKLKLIREEIQRLEKFLLELGSFTRIAPIQKTPGNLLALVQEIEEMMEGTFKETGVDFQLQAPPEIPPCLFDAGQIRQVLLNIFKNAVEAMPRGGRLTAALELQQNHLTLTVTDTGHGIRPEHLQELFTPFFTTKPGGTGLGLSICRHIIEQHQGEIQIFSEPEQGATCRIRLPLC